MATLAPAETGRHAFFRRMALGLSIFIMFGFLQFAARGFVDYRTVPVAFHLHAMAMTAWLGLLVVQSHLADRGSLALHRRLGWSSAGLVPVIWVLAMFAVVSALRVRFVPPFFTPGFFLALVVVEGTIFAGVVTAAIRLRRQTDWHSRLLIGATIVSMEPALGRLLPMPLLGPWGQTLAMLVQLGTLGLVVRFDRRALGMVHPATKLVAGAILLAHGLTEWLGRTPLVIDAAARIAG